MLRQRPPRLPPKGSAFNAARGRQPRGRGGAGSSPSRQSAEGVSPGAVSTYFANITFASRKAMSHICGLSSQLVGLVETHLTPAKATRVSAQLRAHGFKSWVSPPLPSVGGAAPPGGVLIAAKEYMRVRSVALRPQGNDSSATELAKHCLAVEVRGRQVCYLFVVLYCRPSIGMAGNWALVSAVARALRVERRPWVLAADWS